MIEIIDLVSVNVHIFQQRLVHIRTDIGKLSRRRKRCEHRIGKHEYIGEILSHAVKRNIVRCRIRPPLQCYNNIVVRRVEVVDKLQIVRLFRIYVTACKCDLDCLARIERVPAVRISCGRLGHVSAASARTSRKAHDSDHTCKCNCNQSSLFHRFSS